MTHLGADLLMGYARRTLDAEALLLADDHLSGCTECRGRLVDEDGLRATVLSLRRDLAAARHAPTSHLPYDQIEARAEGRLRGAAREVAEIHLEACAPCAAQTRDLEAFATAFRDARPRATVAGAAAADAEMDAPGSSPAGAARVTTTAGAAGVAGPAAAAGTNGAAAHGDTAAKSRAACAAGDARPGRRSGARTALRLSEEALAEEPALRPGQRVAAIFSAAQPEERSRSGLVALAILGAAILVALGYGGRAGWQRLTTLKGQVQELERRNETLQAAAASRSADDASVAPGGAAGGGEIAGSAPSPAAPAPDAPAAPAPGSAPEATAPVSARRALTIQDRKGPVGLDSEGDLVGFDGLPVSAGKVLAAALRRGGVDVPDEIRSLAASRPVPADPGLGPEPPAASGETTVALATAAGTYVRSTRPVLAWAAVEGATAYRVGVFAADGTAIARAGPMRGTSWTVPRPLVRGGLYEWRVVALRPAEPGTAVPAADPATAAPADAPAPAVETAVPAAAPPSRGAGLERIAAGAARFKVLGSDESAALERGLRGAPGSRLVAGVLSARAGLLDDAERELKALAGENPDSDVARGLLASVEAARLP